MVVRKVRLFLKMPSDHKRNGGSEGKTSLAERKKPLAVPLTTGNRSREVVGGQLSVVGGGRTSKLRIGLVWRALGRAS
jgi:hypothetical protein